MPGPAPSPKRTPLLVGALVTVLVLGAAASVAAGRAARSHWAELLARWEAARPALESTVRELVVEELLARLPDDHAWRLEGGDAAGALLDELAREHLDPVFEVRELPASSGLLTDRRGLDVACRLDFPLPVVGEPVGALADALPNVRFVDVEVRVRLERRGLLRDESFEVVPGGAWLDGEVGELVTDALRGSPAAP